MSDLQDLTNGRELVMVSNRLPVDRVISRDGSTSWRTSPGGLVTAVEPIVEQLGCLWIGWAGSADEHIDDFEVGSMRLAPVELSAEDIEFYYEGFSNGTLWPLYHDVIAQPEYNRGWWERYRKINERFAERVAEQAARNAIVWVHDYQLQLVPQMLRQRRPDLTIGFFLHIPFPPIRLFAQLPWRKRIVEGLLGADVVGFQQVADAAAFRLAAERYAHMPALGNKILVSPSTDEPSRTVLAQEFPISIDMRSFAEVAARPEVQRRAAEIREELGNPKTLMLGVDRLDYTKGIRHRLKAYNELLAEGEIDVTEMVFVQVATPSREQVEAYRQLRDEVEVTVGRINGEHGTIGHAPLVYLHRSFTRDEMVALYLAADVLLVTPLRDGMNLVAKEYAACRADERGVLVLSEFAGAADEMRDAVLVNPHDIEGLKAAIVRAAHMPVDEQRRRMRSLRRAVADNDVAHWAAHYLGAVQAIADARGVVDTGARTDTVPLGTQFVSRSITDRLRRFATTPTLIVATDFDGTISPLVARPEDARILPRARRALQVLSEAPGTAVVVITGRSLAGLAATGLDYAGWIVSGSHGSELAGIDGTEEHSALTTDEVDRLDALARRLNRVLDTEAGALIERKPFGIAVHTRRVYDREMADEQLAAAVEVGQAAGMFVRAGKEVREFSVRSSDKGEAINRIRAALPPGPVLFIGDDVTDEDVFRVLGPDDFGIKVGHGTSAASERVSDPESAAAVLALLAELRTGTVIGSG